MAGIIYQKGRSEMNFKHENHHPRGVARKIDELGRMTISVEYRRTLDIDIGDKVEMILYDNGVFVRKVDDGK